MSLFPVFLKLNKRKCLVVGAGEIAEGKIQSLVSAGADLTVVSPDARASVATLAQEGRITWHRREFALSDLENMFLVVAATDSVPVNAAVYREAEKKDILCNAVDDPPHCDFYFPSTVRRGKLQIAISTAGESPALAQQLRKEIDAQLPGDLGPWLDHLGELRREVLASIPAGESRKLLLHELAQRHVCGSQHCPSRQMARDAALMPVQETVHQH